MKSFAFCFRFFFIFSLIFIFLTSSVSAQEKFNYLGKFFANVFQSFFGSYVQKAEGQEEVVTVVYKAMIGEANWSEIPNPSTVFEGAMPINTKGGFDLAFTPKRELTSSEKENLRVEIKKVPQMGKGELIGVFRIGEEISLPVDNKLFGTGTDSYRYYARLIGDLPNYQFLSRCEKIDYTQTATGNFVPPVYRTESFSPIKIQAGQKKVECILGFAPPWGPRPRIEVKGGDVPTGEVIEEKPGVGSLEFMGNILDYTRADETNAPSSGLSFSPFTNTIVAIRFLKLEDGKKVLLVLRNDSHLLVYDISNNPFSPILLKDNLLSDFKVFPYGLKLLTIDNFNYVFFENRFNNYNENKRTAVFRIQSDGLLSLVNHYPFFLTGLFRGLDNKVYGYDDVYSDKRLIIYSIDFNSYGIKEIFRSEQFASGLCDLLISPSTNLGHYDGRRGVINKDGKLYLVVPGYFRCSDFHKDHQVTIFVFDVSNPSNPQVIVRGPVLAHLWRHFIPATDFEDKFVSATVGVYLYVDETTGKIFDFYPSNFDVNHYFGTTSNVDFPSDAFYRLQNGLVVFSIDPNSPTSFQENSRHLLCEKKVKGGLSSGPGFSCGGSLKLISNDDYMPLVGSQQNIVNGVLFLKKPYKSEVKKKEFRFDVDSGKWKSYIETSKYLAYKGVVAVLNDDGSLVVVPDPKEETTKYLFSLKNPNLSQTNYFPAFPALDVSDAVVVQVDDKNFAIYQSHTVSLDVVKLTLKDPRPMPSDSNSQPPSPSSNQPPRQLNNLYRDIYNTLRYTEEVLMRILYGW